MAGSVFVSYASEDQVYARDLAKYLRAQGITVWLDQDLVPGQFWESVLRSQLERASAVIVIISPASSVSSWVSQEVIGAAERQVPIFPLLLAGQAPRSLRHIQYEDVTDGRMPSRRFVDTVRLSLNLAGPTTRTTAVPIPTPAAPQGGSSPTATETVIAVPDHLATLPRILEILEQGQRAARRQLWVGTLLGLPVGVLGAWVARLIGWG